ncbi:hypothetical protein ACJW30_01G250500 [Castanea mollissima]
MLFVSLAEFCLFILLFSKIHDCCLLHLGLFEEMLGLESMEIAFSGLGFLGGSSSFCEVIDWNLDPLLEA